MSHWMRRHKRSILVVVVALVGIPFVFWGGGYGRLSGRDGRPGDAPQVVAQVGSIPIMSRDFMRRYNDITRSRSAGGEPPTAEELVLDGTVEQILQLLVSDALFSLEMEGRDLRPERGYLIETLKEGSFFKDDEGRFDRGLWNRWVEGNERANWNTIYNQVSSQVGRQVFASLVVASARVLDADVKSDFIDSKTRVRVRHAAIEPRVEQTEEELKAFYDGDTRRFRTPTERTAEFIAVSIAAPRPALVDELVERARAGEDFAALAREHSEGPGKGRGGDLGWMVETELLPEHRRVLFELRPGDVGDPVEGPLGLYIYKVEEERESEIDGLRDVKAREIVIRPTLEEGEKEARRARARALAEAVKEAEADQEADALRAVAEREGLEVLTTNPFTLGTGAIENVPPVDALIFRRAFGEIEKGGFSDVIEGRKNLYVARVIELVEPQRIPFDEAREDVERHALNAYKQTPEYAAAVQQSVNDIRAVALNLEEAKRLFPELELEIQETEPFAQSDFLFSSGVFWNCREAFELVKDRQPGTLAGPITDFRQTAYFLELVETTAPDPSVWTEDWSTDKDRLRDAALAVLQVERQQDYLQYLRERAAAEFLIQEDYGAIATLLGLEGGSDERDQETDAPPAETAQGDDAAVDDSPAEAGADS